MALVGGVEGGASSSGLHGGGSGGCYMLQWSGEGVLMHKSGKGKVTGVEGQELDGGGRGCVWKDAVLLLGPCEKYSHGA